MYIYLGILFKDNKKNVILLGNNLCKMCCDKVKGGMIFYKLNLNFIIIYVYNVY